MHIGSLMCILGHIDLLGSYQPMFTYTVESIDRPMVVSFGGFRAAQKAYYCMWRAPDGSIPWVIRCNGYKIDPRTGEIMSECY